MNWASTAAGGGAARISTEARSEAIRTSPGRGPSPALLPAAFYPRGVEGFRVLSVRRGFGQDGLACFPGAGWAGWGENAEQEGVTMGVLPDWRIKRDVKIEPFEEGLARKGVVSYGLSSYGYDVRVGRKFKVFTNVHCAVVDPKHF